VVAGFIFTVVMTWKGRLPGRWQVGEQSESIEAMIFFIFPDNPPVRVRHHDFPEQCAEGAPTALLANLAHNHG